MSEAQEYDPPRAAWISGALAGVIELVVAGIGAWSGAVLVACSGGFDGRVQGIALGAIPGALFGLFVASRRLHAERRVPFVQHLLVALFALAAALGTAYSPFPQGALGDGAALAAALLCAAIGGAALLRSRGSSDIEAVAIVSAVERP